MSPRIPAARTVASMAFVALLALAPGSGSAEQAGVRPAPFDLREEMIPMRPALKAISPQASPADMWIGDDFHHNGAFRFSYAFEYAYSVDGAKKGQNFRFDRYDTYDWYLALGSLSNVNDRFLHGGIPGRRVAAATRDPSAPLQTGRSPDEAR